jgi:hypothetical protein
MFQLRVVLDQPKNWPDYVPAWITAGAAFLTVVVAVIIAWKQSSLQTMLSNTQSDIQKLGLAQQERRLRMDLYDRRYEVFTEAGAFMRLVLSSPEDYDPVSDEARKFADVRQNAEMLFGTDVFKYLQDVADTTMGIWGSKQRMRKNPGDISAIEENGERFQHLSDLSLKRSEAFRHDMFLG